MKAWDPDGFCSQIPLKALQYIHRNMSVSRFRLRLVSRGRGEHAVLPSVFTIIRKYACFEALTSSNLL